MRRASVFVCALCAWLSLAAAAQAPESALVDFDPVLPQLPAATRAELQRHAQQWSQSAPAQRDELRARANAWDALPAAQRDDRRTRYRTWQALPADEQLQVQNARLQFAQLPPEQQQAWRAQFAALDGSEQRGWLLGPTLGADYPALQPLLAQLPADEHAPLLHLLRAMTPRQRRELAVLAQRTPPQERAALRKGLLAASNLDDWLQAQLLR